MDQAVRTDSGSSKNSMTEYSGVVFSHFNRLLVKKRVGGIHVSSSMELYKLSDGYGKILAVFLSLLKGMFIVFLLRVYSGFFDSFGGWLSSFLHQSLT